MPNKRAKPSRTRIIGGKWRGRKLPIAAGVRPTPNRARETVFNWLAPTLPGARVLDVFAGTGALAFEALSRGARAATLLEINAATVRLLAAQKQQLAAEAEIVCADAVRWLRRHTEARWELAFLDPPFASSLLADALPLVLAKLTPAGIVYVEAPPEQFQAALAAVGLSPLREARAGAVRFGLVRKPSASRYDVGMSRHHGLPTVNESGPRTNDVPSSAAEGFFEDVLGVAPSVFLEEIFEQRHHGPHRTAARLCAAEVATMADVDYVLNHAALPPEDIHIIQGGSAVPDRRAFDRNHRANVEYIYQRFTQGASFRVHDVQRYLPRVADFGGQLAAALAIEVDANIYVSPGNGEALGVHYDGHDVLVLQCVGSKRWRLFAPGNDTPRLPRRLAQRHDPARHRPGDLVAEASLAPGDALYVPRGTMHDAVAEGEASLHLTFPIRTPTWGELALSALRLAMEEDVALRTAVPYAMRADPASADPAQAPAMIRALLAEGRLAQTLEEYQYAWQPEMVPAPHWFSAHQNGLDATERLRAIVKAGLLRRRNTE